MYFNVIRKSVLKADKQNKLNNIDIREETLYSDYLSTIKYN